MLLDALDTPTDTHICTTTDFSHRMEASAAGVCGLTAAKLERAGVGIHGEVLQLHGALGRDCQSSARQYRVSSIVCSTHFIMQHFIPLSKLFTHNY